LGEKLFNLINGQSIFVFSIGENSNHLPSMFGLCAMGLIQDNDTLTEAAIQEMLKIPFGEAGTAISLYPKKDFFNMRVICVLTDTLLNFRLHRSRNQCSLVAE
jgi:hypothetical protein